MTALRKNIAMRPRPAKPPLNNKLASSESTPSQYYGHSDSESDIESDCDAEYRYSGYSSDDSTHRSETDITSDEDDWEQCHSSIEEQIENPSCSSYTPKCAAQEHVSEVPTGTGVEFDDLSECESVLDEEDEREKQRRAVEADISALTKQGPAKPKHKPRTTALVQREFEFWTEFSHLIEEKQNEKDPIKLLMKGNPIIFKAYMQWRKRNSRIKKSSAMRAYWKRLSIAFRLHTNKYLAPEVLNEISNWFPELGLDLSKKIKKCIYVEDLHTILYTFWTEDKRAMHGRMRVQIAAILLISAATATRPGALVESNSKKDSNEVLQWKDIEIEKVRDPSDSSRTRLVMRLDLVNIKGAWANESDKKFIFREEDTLSFCVISLLTALALSEGAFGSDIMTWEDIEKLKVPDARQVLRLKWNQKSMAKPVFRKVQETGSGINMVDKAMPSGMYNQTLKRVGLLAGFETTLEPYQIRRGSGMRLHEQLTPEERNLIMGHKRGSSTWEQFYRSNLVEKDCQAIYFGTISEEALIKSVARMGLTRDKRAPSQLTREQLEELKLRPELSTLAGKQRNLKQKMEYNFGSVRASQGERIWNKHREVKAQYRSVFEKLKRQRLVEVIKHFHDTIDTEEINIQLRGDGVSKPMPERRPVFELVQRRVVVEILFGLSDIKDQDSDRTIRAILIKNLTELCMMCESSQFDNKFSANFHQEDVKIQESEVCVKLESSELLSTGSALRPDQQANKFNMSKTGKDRSYRCLFCLYNPHLSSHKRNKIYTRRFCLQSHVDTHLRKRADVEFECPDPVCREPLKHNDHFRNHASKFHCGY